jgi:hypothetical protein
MTTTGQIIKTPDTTVGPNFFVPPGVVDLRYLNEEEAAALDEETDVVDDTTTPTDDGAVEFTIIDEAVEDDTDLSLGSAEIPAPDWIQIVEQIVKFGEDGTCLIDVIIETQDIPGVQQIDVAVTKV